jgi:type IV secretory pathway VirD2 relaxase
MTRRSGGSDQPFEVRLGRMRSPSGSAKVQGFFRQVQRSAQRVSLNKRGYRQTRGQMSAQFHRRVLIKVNVQPMARHGRAAQASHLNYIQRDSAARDGEEGRLFDAASHDADAQVFEESGRGDRHQFRIIVSPEDGNELSDLKAYTRDLVSAMEHDLETKLDWVAADHYDTGQPHVHLVIRGKRDNSQDLVIPKRYIAHGIRGRAQELVELELGPMLEIDGRRRSAQMVQQERFTDLDRQLERNNDDGIIHFSDVQKSSKPWRAQLLKKRLKTLEGFGLARSNGKGQWRIDPEAEQTLKRMGARGDMVKAMHQALRQTRGRQVIDGASVFDPTQENARAVIGQIITIGVADDVHDRGYLIVDGVDGKATYIDIGPTDRLAMFKVGHIVEAHPPASEARKADITIDDIAQNNVGRYSAALHMEGDPKSRPAFVEAHVRRLEAMRRAGHATRHSDGTWSVPPDYLVRAGRYERDAALKRPVQIETVSRLTLKQMVTANGETWLDSASLPQGLAMRGFATEVQTALNRRRAILVKLGFLKTPQSQMTDGVRRSLLRSDLNDAATALVAELEKPYRSSPMSGAIKGHYLKSIDRPSGRFAVIERGRDFTLVPWRDVMDRRLGQSISGHIHRGKISWTVTRGRSLPSL